MKFILERAFCKMLRLKHLYSTREQPFYTGAFFILLYLYQEDQARLQVRILGFLASQ